MTQPSARPTILLKERVTKAIRRLPWSDAHNNNNVYWTQINFRNILCSNNRHRLLLFRAIVCDFYDEHIQTVMKCPYEKALKCIHTISMSSI